MASLKDLPSVALRAPGNMCFTAAGSAVGGTTTKHKTANAVTYLYDGVFKSYGAADNVIVVAPTSTQLPYSFQEWALYNMTTAGPTAAVTFYVVAALDSAGAAVFFQGDYAGQNLAFRGKPLQKGTGGMPQIPDGFIPYAYMKFVFSTGASTFTWGTTALATAGNLTISFVDISMLPSAL